MDEPELSGAIFSPHALREIERRGLSIADIRAVLAAPPRVQYVRKGRVVITALVERPGRSPFAIRVFVDVDRPVPVVVTAYRSSKINKYWGQ